MTVVSCLFVLRDQVRLVNLVAPYMAHWGQSLHTCVPGESLYTSGKV